MVVTMHNLPFAFWLPSFVWAEQLATPLPFWLNRATSGVSDSIVLHLVFLTQQSYIWCFPFTLRLVSWPSLGCSHFLWPWRAVLFQAVQCHTGISVPFSRPGRQCCFRAPFSKLEVHLLSPVPLTWKPLTGFWVVFGARGMMWSHVLQYWPLMHCLVVFGARGTM